MKASTTTWAVIFGLLLLFPLASMAQKDLFVEHISTEQGLSQGLIFDILQDREGFLWLATKDGLNRYDGYQFKVFTNDPDDPSSIAGNTVTSLFEDAAGRIWAAVDNAGLSIYDKASGRFHHIKHAPEDPQSLSANFVSTIIEDTLGYFVLGIEESEINILRLNEEFFRSEKAPSVVRLSMPTSDEEQRGLHTELKGIARDAKGRVWVGGENALFQLNVQTATLTPAFSGYSIGTVFSPPDGSLWSCGFRQPLFHWDGTNAHRFPIPFRKAVTITMDDQANMWLVTPDTLFLLQLTDWQAEESAEQATERILYQWKLNTPSNDDYPIRSMIIDQSGLIWLGTNGHGLYKINPNRMLFKHYLSGISIRQITQMLDDDIYALSYDAAWYQENGTKLGGNPFQPENESLFVDFLILTKSGHYWLRQPSPELDDFSIKSYDPGTGATHIYELDWHHYDTQPMIEGQDGMIWMAGYNGVLTSIDPQTKKIESYQLTDGKNHGPRVMDKKIFSQESSSALYEDAQGVLWVGTKQGITKCVRSLPSGGDLQVTRYANLPGDKSSLSYNHVTCFLADPHQPDRYLWVATKGGGLNRLDKKSGTFLRLSQEDGLPNNVIYGLLSDDEGNLWGSTNNGIFCLSFDTASPKGDELAGNKHLSPEASTYVFRNFSTTDGLQALEFNIGAYARLANGDLAFGGVNGITIFNPSEVVAGDFNPPVYITDILINNNPISPKDKVEIIKNTPETTQKITLTHLQNILTIEFAALDFNTPVLNRYRYQLVGVDDSWVESSTHRSATFLNLSPGSYTFRVQGTNSRGIWSDKTATLSIIVLPPWWKTWWAYASYLLILGTIIWKYFQFSINRARLHQQLTYEKKEAERMKDLDALKTQLYTNMTHEFRTPLTIILGMAQQIKEQAPSKRENGLDLIIRNGQNLLGLVNKMLNLSKLENGKMTLELVQGDVITFLRNLIESFLSLADNKDIQLHFLPEVDILMMDFDADKLQQVISNLISNAFKFTPEGGHIYFSIRKEEAVVTIRIKDTGRGIPQEELDQVFERFYQVDNTITRAYEGTGIGLALVKELVTLMKGKITVQSPPIGANRGAEFILEFPYDQPSEESSKERLSTPANKGIAKAVGTTQPTESTTALTITPTTPRQSPKPAQILLVEDNIDVVAYVASCLPDHELAVAENGQEGLEVAMEMIPDLIISDVMMPVMDGFELCRRLKANQLTDHIPVILLTAKTDFSSKIEGLELGASAYLPKPFDKQELLLLINNLLDLRNKLRRHHQQQAGLAPPETSIESASVENTPNAPFVNKVIAIVEEHIGDLDFTVEQLARELHLSHSQLRRKLDALTGVSPNHFIRFLRLKKARKLLLTSDLSITAISYDCGFNDPSYFSRVFKKEYGTTPMAWRSAETR